MYRCVEGGGAGSPSAAPSFGRAGASGFSPLLLLACGGQGEVCWLQLHAAPGFAVAGATFSPMLLLASAVGLGAPGFSCGAPWSPERARRPPRGCGPLVENCCTEEIS